MSSSSGSKYKLVYNATSGKGDEVKAHMWAGGALTSQSGALDVYQKGVFAEDAAAASGDLGQAILLVRQDTLAASTSADGDYGHFKSSNLGELYVKDTSVLAAIGTGNADLASILAEIQALSFAEDSAHSSGDMGIGALAVRNDNAATTLTSANGDYSFFAVDSKGRQFTVESVPQSGSHGSVDVAATATLIVASAAERREFIVQNSGAEWIAIGFSNSVTYDAAAPNSTDGILIPPGGEKFLEIGTGIDAYGIAEANTSKVRYAQLVA